MEKISTFITYWLSVALAWFGTQTPDRFALYIGGSCAIFTALVNFWYRRKTFNYLRSMGLNEGGPVNSIVKRCSVGVVLALTILMPDFHLLRTSPEGLALIADLEGCRLRPYQCSAGVWTSGIGHTAGVVPKRDITERDAAENLVADSLNVEQQLAACVPVDMPQSVYDALVSFSFNVGTAAACRSTLVAYLKRRQWEQACDQLSRWIYVNGVKSKGLENRRQRERAYCLKGTQ